MKRIIISLAVVGAVAAAVVVGTTAFFSDTKQSTGNTFTAGTINISVGETGLVPVHLADMKPSQVAYSNFTVTNTGTNPVNVTKEIKNVDTADNGTNEPECIAEGGEWVNGQCTGGWEQKHDIDSVVQYDLSVKVYNPQGQLVWNQTLNDMDKTIAQKNGQPSFLGMIPAGWHMDVVESYHMNSQAGNEYQSDSMSFDILLTGTQLTGTAVLSNKDPNRPVQDGWFVLGTKTGTLTYGVKDDKFNYTFVTSGLAAAPGTSYSLIHYADPYPGNGAGSVGLIGSGLANGSGEISLAGSPDFDKDMINAKVWLVPSASYNAGTKSIIGWAPTTYLFDTGLLDYYDSVKP